jgi:HAE1 family hydrophobic/amphiphilic exporter-1
MLVDNAVVVLESIHRRRHAGASPVAAALRGTKDVGRAIVASTLTTVIVFAPIVVTKQNELAVWLGTVGATISVTIVGSLIVSLTVIPAMSVWLSRGGSNHEDAAWIKALKARYLQVLRWTTVRRPRLTGFVIIPGTLVLTAALIAVTGFKPDVESDEGIKHERLRMSFRYTGPVDKRTSQAYVERVEEYLEGRREELGLRDIYSYWGADYAGLSLFFERGELSPEFLEETRDDLREGLPVQAGLEYRFGDEEGNDTGVKAFRLTIFGEETEYLEEIAESAKRRLEAIEGVSDVFSDFDRGHPEIQVAIDREKAGRHGIRARNIAQVLSLTYRGMLLPRLNTGEKEIDLQISLLPEDAESIENLATTLIAVENGQPILLGQVADFSFQRSPQTIYRQDRRTGVAINGSWDGERLDDGLEKIKSVMNELEMPFGYAWTFGSEIRRAQEQNDDMGGNLLLALLCVFFVMASLFESLVHPGIVMGCVPFASLGVVWLMMATGTPFNIMAFIGMVILIGIVVNNGIVLVDHVNHHRRTGKPMEEAILEGCTDRMRPILMTAGTTIIGLLPLAMSGAHMANAEYYPMARAIIGGLISSTFLTLIVLPTYYRLVNGWVDTVRSVVAGGERRAMGARPTESAAK